MPNYISNYISNKRKNTKTKKQKTKNKKQKTKKQKNKKIKNKKNGGGIGTSGNFALNSEDITTPDFGSTKTLRIVGPKYLAQFKLNINGQLRNYVLCGENHDQLFSINYKTREEEMKHYSTLNNIINEYFDNPKKTDKYEIMYENIDNYIANIEYDENGMYLLDYLIILAARGSQKVDIFCETTINNRVSYRPNTAREIIGYRPPDERFAWLNKNIYQTIMFQMGFIFSMCNKPYSNKEKYIHSGNEMVNKLECQKLFPNVRYHSTDTRFLETSINFSSNKDENADFLKQHEIKMVDGNVETIVKKRDKIGLCRRYIRALYLNDEIECVKIFKRIQQFNSFTVDERYSLPPTYPQTNAHLIHAGMLAFRQSRSQLVKSVFFETPENLEENIQKFIRTFDSNKWNVTMNTDFDESVDNPRNNLHIMIDMLQMNLYSMFRMFPLQWKRNDEPTIVFCYFGMNHTIWIFQFIKLWYNLQPSDYVEINNKVIEPINMMIN
jgi:hypothetical protein